MKLYCYDCNQDVDVNVIQESKEYTYRNHTFHVLEDIYYCSKCGSELVCDLDEDLKKIYNGYLGLFGLNLDSFKEIRESLNLDIKRFSKALGWGFKSVYRYENRESIPEGEYLNVYINLNKNKDYILEKLYQNKINMNEDEYYDILNRINLNVDIKSRQVILYILNEGPKYIINIVKTLFAIDFLSMKERGKSITNFNYVKMQYGPNIDGYLNVLNNMLGLKEIKICDSVEIDGDFKNKYINNISYDKNLFNDEELNIINRVLDKVKNKSAKYLSDWFHHFKGWIDTPNGKIINMKKYAKYFDISSL